MTVLPQGPIMELGTLTITLALLSIVQYVTSTIIPALSSNGVSRLLLSLLKGTEGRLYYLVTELVYVFCMNDEWALMSSLNDLYIVLNVNIQRAFQFSER